jgi:hypothetical protein
MTGHQGRGTSFVSSWIVSFHPLACTRGGLESIAQYKLRPFIDGSCRSEPDLLAVYPSVTGLCRERYFIPRVRVGDEILYITVKRTYGLERAHHRLVAHLLVLEEFESHELAAYWYAVICGMRVPSNCMVSGSEPIPLDRTHRLLPELRSVGPERRLVAWDQGYWKRAARVQKVLACERLFSATRNPPPIEEEDWLGTLGYVPSTQTPTDHDPSKIRELVCNVRKKPRPTVFRQVSS